VKVVSEFYAFVRGLRKSERQHRLGVGQCRFGLLGQHGFGLLGQRARNGRWAGKRPGLEGGEGKAEWAGWAKWTKGF
jgi:hypothetical protein